MRIATTFSLLCCLTLCPWLHADDNWPEFRGPQGRGDAGDVALPVDFSNERQLVWKVDDPHGRGWSSPVIWGDQLWITTATLDGTKQYAVCYDKNSGEVIHDLLVFENVDPQEAHITNSYASCTPAIEEGRIYVHFGSFGTACIDTASGEKLWERRDLPCDHHRGPASSPVIDDKNLYVPFDGFDLQYVVALDKKTGKTVWKKDRNIDYGTNDGDRMKAYSTGTLINHEGVRQLILPSAVETITYDPETGDELWRVRHGWMNAAIRPIYEHGLVYIFAGDGPNKMVAVDPAGRGDLTSDIRLRLSKGVPMKPSPIMLGERLYMIEDQGVASCVNALTGESIWQKRIGQNYRASMIHAGGHIYTLSDEGLVTVFAAKDEYEEIAQHTFPAGFQASPAASGKKLYLRSMESLYCFEK